MIGIPIMPPCSTCEDDIDTGYPGILEYEPIIVSSWVEVVNSKACPPCWLCTDPSVPLIIVFCWIQ